MKIFVSYSRRDRDLAQHLHEYFKGSVHDIFTDVDNIGPGDVWSDVIEKNISNCDIFVIIVTPAALRSPEVEKEILQAQRENKTSYINMKLPASAPAILGGVSALSLLVIVYLCFTCSSAYAQQYKATPQLTTHSSLTQNKNNNVTNNTTLSVSGSATTKVKPDKVILTLGVETTNQTAEAALDTNSAAMNKVLNALLSVGVKQNETSTSAFSISPNYNYSQGRNIITGFTTTNSIQIESSHINDTAKWIDTAIAGANNVNNVAFTISDKKLEETKNLLIKEAISNARSKADIAASTLGLKVVGVKSTSLNEFEALPPRPLLAAQPYAATGAANTATPIISGQEQVSTNVSIVYLID